jgi:hypothetical protein
MDDHWLTRASNIKRLWGAFTIMLVIVVVLDLVIDHHAYFGFDGTFGFGAWFGFLSCVVLIVGAKGLGSVLKRPDTYYDS